MRDRSDRNTLKNVIYMDRLTQSYANLINVSENWDLDRIMITK